MHNFSAGSKSLCVECILNPPVYSGARSFGFYSGEIARLVHGLKFLKRRNLVAILAPMLAETFHKNWSAGEFDIVIPIPLHSSRKRDRGFNQSGLIARTLARRIGVPFSGMILERVRATSSQVGLSNSRRHENVSNAFRCNRPECVSGRRILLIDDVMTTGATVGSAAEELMRSGALRVSVLTLARTE